MSMLVLVGPKGQIVCERCELAEGVVSRTRGLIGRTRLPRGRGMLIRPTWFAHTAFMRFPIDVIFLYRLAARPPTCVHTPCSSSLPEKAKRSPSRSVTN
jgi:uncharacterized membrane protein (UPF0127 family)